MLDKTPSNTSTASTTISKKDRRVMLTIKKKCPDCGKISFYRIPREWWMRLLPGSRHYCCLECLQKFVLLQTIVH